MSASGVKSRRRRKKEKEKKSVKTTASYASVCHHRWSTQAAWTKTMASFAFVRPNSTGGARKPPGPKKSVKTMASLAEK